MILEINNTEFVLEDEITIRQYYRIKDKEYLKEDPVSFISALTGVDDKLIRQAPKKDIDFVFRYLIGRYVNPPKMESKPIITFKGKEYGLQTQLSEMNFGSFVDMEMYISEGIENNIHKLLSIFYRPIVKKEKDKYILEEYDGDTANERAELFMDLPMSVWYGVQVFFSLYAKEFLKIIQASLRQKRKREILKFRIQKIKRMIRDRLRRMWEGFIGNV